MSLFKDDLKKEQILGIYLDEIYNLLRLDIQRTSDMDLQHKGIDITYNHNGKKIYIDEKAQLHYINKSLTTFTFELSYLKEGKERIGWFLDPNKKTQYYFLITSIYTVKRGKLEDGITSCKITSVDRLKLKKYLKSIGLNNKKITKYKYDLRNSNSSQYKVKIPELDYHKQGCLVYSDQLIEKPINLMLKLEYLISVGIAKQLYPRVA